MISTRKGGEMDYASIFNINALPDVPLAIVGIYDTVNATLLFYDILLLPIRAIISLNLQNIFRLISRTKVKINIQNP